MHPDDHETIDALECRNGHTWRTKGFLAGRAQPPPGKKDGGDWIVTYEVDYCPQCGEKWTKRVPAKES